AGRTLLVAVIRKDDFKRRLSFDAALSHVADHADHFAPLIPLALPKNGDLADRVFARPEPVGEPLADDKAPRLLDDVVFVEPAPRQQRQAHRLEKVLRYDAPR